MNDQPILTRRLKVCFDVEVQARRLPEEMLAKKPDLAILQQALLDQPHLFNLALVYWTLSEVENHIQEMYDPDGWLPGGPDAALQDAVRSLPLVSLRPLFYEKLVHQMAAEYVEELFGDGFASRLSGQVSLLDLESGETLPWQVEPTSVFHLVDEQQRYLVADVQGEKVLCLNLQAFQADDILEQVADEVDRQGVVIDRILAFIEAGALPAREHDNLVVQIAEVFPGLRVEVWAKPASQGA